MTSSTGSGEKVSVVPKGSKKSGGAKGYTTSTLNSKKQAIDIPKQWFDNLEDSQEEAVKDNVKAINESSFTFIVDTAKGLKNIKETLPEGNWIAFTTSSENGIVHGSRTILDLVKAEPWLTRISSEVKASLLGSMSPRVLSMLAGIEESATNARKFAEEAEDPEQKKNAIKRAEAEDNILSGLEARLRNGDKLTEKNIREAKGIIDEPKDPALTKKTYIVLLENARATIKTYEAKQDELTAENTTLVNEKAALQAQLDTAQRTIAGLTRNIAVATT